MPDRDFNCFVVHRLNADFLSAFGYDVPAGLLANSRCYAFDLCRSKGGVPELFSERNVGESRIHVLAYMPHTQFTAHFAMPSLKPFERFRKSSKLVACLDTNSGPLVFVEKDFRKEPIQEWLEMLKCLCIFYNSLVSRSTTRCMNRATGAKKKTEWARPAMMGVDGLMRIFRNTFLGHSIPPSGVFPPEIRSLHPYDNSPTGVREVFRCDNGHVMAFNAGPFSEFAWSTKFPYVLWYNMTNTEIDARLVRVDRDGLPTRFHRLDMGTENFVDGEGTEMQSAVAEAAPGKKLVAIGVGDADRARYLLEKFDMYAVVEEAMISGSDYLAVCNDIGEKIWISRDRAATLMTA